MKLLTQFYSGEKLVYSLNTKSDFPDDYELQSIDRWVKMVREWIDIEFRLRVGKFSSGNLKLNKPFHLKVSLGDRVLFSTKSVDYLFLENSLVLTKNRVNKVIQVYEYLADVYKFNLQDFLTSPKPNQLPFLKYFKNKEVNFILNDPNTNENLTLKSEGGSIKVRSKGSELLINYRNNRIETSNLNEVNPDSTFSYFLKNPLRVIVESNKSAGKCCFCDKDLSTENSNINGYGKTCAEKYELPYFQI